MRRTLLALGGVAMLATACGSSHGTTVPATAPVVATVPSAPSDTAPPPTAAPTTSAPTIAAPTTAAPTTTTTTVDTGVVPPEITVAYVDAVLVKLNHLYGDAVRSSVKADKVTPAASKDLQAIYSKPLAKAERGDFAQTIAGGLQNIRPIPGDPVTSVQKLVFASPSCIYARVTTDSDPAVIHPVARAADEFMGFEHPAARRPKNQTPWVLFFDGVTETPSNIANQCPS